MSSNIQVSKPARQVRKQPRGFLTGLHCRTHLGQLHPTVLKPLGSSGPKKALTGRTVTRVTLCELQGVLISPSVRPDLCTQPLLGHGALRESAKSHSPAHRGQPVQKLSGLKHQKLTDIKHLRIIKRPVKNRVGVGQPTAAGQPPTAAQQDCKATDPSHPCSSGPRL